MMTRTTGHEQAPALANEAGTSRRRFMKMAGATLLWLAGRSAGAQEAPALSSAKPKGLRMKITKVEPILTGSDVFLKIETDAGIVGYGDGTTQFLPCAVEGTLKDVIPYLIGEDLHSHKLAVQQQIEYLAAIRKAVGDKIDLILECHGRYDPVWALELARRAEPYRPFLIEDPIRHENPQAMAQVRAGTRLPLATGERFHSKWDFREMIVNSYVDYLRPDVCHCGGLTEMRKIAAFAEVFYLNLIPHNNAGPLGTAATLHAALAIPNVDLIEAPWVNSDAKTDVVGPYPRVVDGYALPLEGPGLGVTCDEKLARSKPFRKPGLQPRLNDPDGSVRDF